MDLGFLQFLSPAAAMASHPDFAKKVGGATSPLLTALLSKHGGGGEGGDVPAPTPEVGSEPSLAPTPGTLIKEQPSMQGAMAGLPRADAGVPAAHGGGFMSRIGDFLKSDEGRAALLRSGAATLASGNIGQGIMAGANFVDQRRHERSAGAEAADEMGLRRQHENNSYNLGLGRLDVDATNAGESARHNRASEGNESYRIDSENKRHLTPTGDKQLDIGERRFEHITPSGDTQTSEAGANYRHSSVSGDTALTQSQENLRNTQDNQTQLMHDRLSAAPTIQTHAHYTTTPEEYARNGPRLRPSQVKPGDSGEAVHHVANDDQYNSLPSGARFMGPDGKVRVKP